MNESPANPDAPFFMGVNFGFYARNGYYSSPEAALEVERMAQTGVDWVCLIAMVFQDTVASTRQYRDFRMTPADDELLEIIDHIHSCGMKVQLRPMLECWDGAQRSHIRFPNEEEIIPGKPMRHWTMWFDSMVERTLHYARLAQKSGCEAYGLDSELDHTIHQQAHWRRVLSAARSVYDGHVTTGHTRAVDFVAELKRDPGHWFKELDSLGSSFYASLADGPGATLDEMVERIQPEVLYYREAARLLGKPFYFAECGCCSTAGATMKPYGWDNPGGYDGKEQALYLETVMQAFQNEPWWGGLLWWKWEEQNDRPWLRNDPRGDKGFPIWGKPAAGIFKTWADRYKSRAALQNISHSKVSELAIR